MGRPRLLAIGEGLGATGYGRVMESVLPLLSGAFEVTLFAVDHRGQGDGVAFGVRGNAVAGDNYGVDQLPALLDEIDPDLVLFHRDAGFFHMHRAAIAAFRRRRPDARVAVWSPADRAVATLSEADVVAFYTRHGLEAAGDGLPDVAVIPHGVDRSHFFPIAGARRRLLPHVPDDAFVVLNANRNQPRKRVGLTMRGFALFAAGRDDAWLYLHMGMRDIGVDVPALAESLGISGRLLATTDGPDRPQVSDSELNLIYNACDVGLNTARAEGFGLVSFEHAATGAAQIVPSVGACAELWEGVASLLPLEPTPEHVAAALSALYDDRALLAERSRRAYEHATAARFSWSTIAGQWESLLLE